MREFIPEKIFVDRSVQDKEITHNILCALNNPSYELIDDPKKTGLSSSLEKGRKHLLITKFLGKVFEHCPAGKPGMMCCNYFIFPFAQNCHMDCEYCFLQFYLNKQIMVVYANIEEMLCELEKVLENKKNNVRVGTGEYADSLALDHLTRISHILVPFFTKQNVAVLELKTKTNNIQNLLNLESDGKTAVSWSLSPQFIADHFEHGTSSLDERLQAALQCAKAGYKIGFHLDPMIHYEDWESGYNNLIHDIFNAIGDYPIEWISLGNLRITNDLKTMMRIRFPQSKLLSTEMVRSFDGRFRYPKQTRIHMYETIWNKILKYRSTQKLYLCMENPDVWSGINVPKTSNMMMFA